MLRQPVWGVADQDRSVAILAQVFKPGATSMLKRAGDISFGAIVALLARPQEGKIVRTHCKVVGSKDSWDFYIGVCAVLLGLLVVEAIRALRRRQAVIPTIRSVTVRGDGARRRWH